VPAHSEESPERRDEEWTYLTADLGDTSCAVCGKSLRAGQAVGHVGDLTVHARCYGPSTTR
jgi:uncharacterized protein (UPF0212 family)